MRAKTAGVMLVALSLGIGIRWSLRGYSTLDTDVFLLPWYDYARAHGWGALRVAFTNYAPFYSYLLIAAAKLDGLAAPLVLIKAISWAFELAGAALAHQIVRAAGASATRAALAFAGVWLAPTVLFNGAAWGQCDAMWTCLLLLAILLYLRGRDGTAAFGMAFAAKAQAVFLGPYVLGLILKRRIPAWSLLAVPVIYVVMAIPVLAAGRPFWEVVRIYAGQAGAYDAVAHPLLYANGASVWALLGRFVPYALGLPLALAVAAIGGLLLARQIGKTRLEEPQAMLLAAATALLATPFLLPMMHERYFFAFEMVAIILAATNREFVWIAVQAQASGLACYLAYDFTNPISVSVAAVINGMLLITLWRRLYAFRANALNGSAAQPGLSRLLQAGFGRRPTTT